MQALSGMIWAGLLHDKRSEDLSREEVLGMMKLNRLEEYVQVTSRAIVTDTGMKDNLSAADRAELFGDEEEENEDSGKEDAATDAEERESEEKADPEAGP